MSRLKRFVTKTVDMGWADVCNICHNEDVTGCRGTIKSFTPKVEWMRLETPKRFWERLFTGSDAKGYDVLSREKSEERNFSFAVCSDCIELMNNHIITERREHEKERKMLRGSGAKILR